MYETTLYLISPTISSSRELVTEGNDHGKRPPNFSTTTCFLYMDAKIIIIEFVTMYLITGGVEQLTAT